MALKNYKSFPLLEEYLNYLLVIKGRSINTIIEYRTDTLMFFQFRGSRKGINQEKYDLSNVDAAYIKEITLNDMYAFISHCQNDKMSAASESQFAAHRSRKIVSIRQFWKYLKTKAHAIDNNVSEVISPCRGKCPEGTKGGRPPARSLEAPKIPKRIPKYLNLEESIRLLIECEKSPRDHCIITMFLNCALRLSELVSINVEQVSGDTLNIVGKGDKERRIFLTPATKKAITEWLEVRKTIQPKTNALFVTKNQTRITGRAVQDIVKKYIKKAGLEHRKISTHKLRHTAATLMYQYGNADLRSLQENSRVSRTRLCTRSVATTEIYTHCSNNQLERTINANPLASMFGVNGGGR